ASGARRSHRRAGFRNGAIPCRGSSSFPARRRPTATPTDRLSPPLGGTSSPPPPHSRPPRSHSARPLSPRIIIVTEQPQYRLGDMTSRDTEKIDKSRSVALVPVGAFEQHGPAMP